VKNHVVKKTILHTRAALSHFNQQITALPYHRNISVLESLETEE